jgi:peptidase C39-like protein
MAGVSKTLPVPYFTQPTGVTCQSTVLKMMAAYIEQNVLFQSTGAAARNIQDIWKDVNQDPKRPVKFKNAHANMKWWLEQHFPSLTFEYTQTTHEDRALESIVRAIDLGFPVLVSVSHERVEGHIILVIGYRNYTPRFSSEDFALVVHDPYGRFDPALLSTMFGAKRYVGGASLMTGSELGPGRSNHVPLPAASRRRAGDAQSGTYYLLSASR